MAGTVQLAIPLRFESRGSYAMRFDAYEHMKFGAVLEGLLRLSIDKLETSVQLTAGDAIC